MKKASKVILINPKKELLLYLGDNKLSISYPGYWDFIGGEVKEGETYGEAIEREIKEEINSEVREIQILGSEVYAPLNTNVTFFKGKIDKTAEKIELSEGQKIKYFKFNELENLHFPPFLKEFIYRNKNKIFD